MKLKTKMTLWFALMMVLLCAVLLTVTIRTSDNMQAATAQKTLMTAIFDNTGRSYFNRGHFVSPFGFRSYSNGVYLQIYNEDGSEMFAGMQPFDEQIDIAPLVDDAEDTVGSSYPCFGKSTLDGVKVYWCMIWLPAPSSLVSGEMASGEMASGEPASGEMADEEPDADNEDEPILRGAWLCGMLPSDGMENMMESVIRAAWFVLPVLVLLSALGAWFITAQSLRPLERITAAADEISSGDDLSRRLELKPGQDEVHRLADTFNGMFERLERAFHAERQFTADASHELRTPVAVILAECDMAKKMPADAPSLLESIDVIGRQGRKMSALIGKLLSFTRLEQGTQKTDCTELDLAELSAAVCADQQAVADRGITVRCAAEAPVTVTGDLSLLTSLLQNLIGNAVKYGKENGHVQVTVSGENGSAAVTVEDDGVGIAPEKLPLVFNRFYQADPARHHTDGSLGLGLCMAQQIARLHGGIITAESTLGEGSVFTFTMPNVR